MLTARIDRLQAQGKSVLQTLSVLGRRFSVPLMRYLIDDSEDFRAVLSDLCGAGFLHEMREGPEPEYGFRHALTQEVAYESILMERRRLLHERAAQSIEALFAGRLDEYWAELAHHYSCSANAGKAVEYRTLAAQQAMQRSAYAHASGHLRAALDLLGKLPDHPDRDHLELTLRTTLGVSLSPGGGWATGEVRDQFDRAKVLSIAVGDSRRLSQALFGIVVFYVMRDEPATALEAGRELLDLSERSGDADLLLVAHSVHAAIFMGLADFARARSHAELAIGLYDSERHAALAPSYGGVD
ncbi:MAG: hypothetical protein ACREQ9_25525, partial [Candidatus Binatia bacterium]